MPQKIIVTDTEIGEVEKILKKLGFGRYVNDPAIGIGKVRRYTDDNHIQAYCCTRKKSDFDWLRPRANGNEGITRILYEDLHLQPAMRSNNGDYCSTAAELYKRLVSKLANPQTAETIFIIR
jgi:hypothetical protein